MTSAVKVAPVITNVTDPTGKEIPNGGVTKGTTVDVKGTSESGKKVDVFDNDTLHSSIIADGSGRWSYVFSKLSVGNHVIKARSGGHESAARSFSVIAPK